MPDDFQDLAQAASKPAGRRGGGKAAKYRRVKKKKSYAGPIAAVLALSVMIAAVVFLVKNRPIQQAPPEPESKSEPVQPAQPDVATPRQKDIHKELENLWATLRDTPRSGRFAPLMDKADKAYHRAAALWESGKFYDFQDYYPEVSAALGAVEKLRLAKQQAQDTRDQAMAAKQAAEDIDAPTLTVALWNKANELDASAKQKLEAEQFADAVADWLDAMQTYKDAEAASQTAMDAEDTRKRFVRKSTDNFTKEELDAHGGESWAKANALIASGDKAYESVQYADALADFKQAVELVPRFERSVQRVHGRNVWALRTGYLATDALLVRAGGEAVESEQKKTLIEAFADLAMDQVIGAALPPENAAYRQWATVLLTQAPQKLETAYGPDAVRCYKIGVHLRLLGRLLERLLERDRESLDPNNLAEMRKSLTTIQQEAQSARFGEEFLERIRAVEAALNAKPVFEAIRSAREALAALIEDLMDYEEAMQLVPRGSK